MAVYRQNYAPGEPVDKSGYLIFDNTHSLYYFNRSQSENIQFVDETDSEMYIDVRDEEGLSFYTHFNLLKQISRYYTPGDEFVILTEENKTITWKTGNELKKIGNFICRNATTSFKGRKWNVWFTEEIPVPAGPWKLFGLPGLIVEAEDETGTFYFYLERLSQHDGSVPIKPPVKGLKVNGWDEYFKLLISRLNRLKRYLESREGLSVKISFDNNIERIENQ